MKVKDLNGRIHSGWPPIGYSPLLDEDRPRSNLHINARKLLKEEFLTASILEEVPLFGIGLFLDFYIPLHKLAIEVNGIQHTQYQRHFHGNIDGFKRAKANDSRKAEWCQLNNIRLVIFPFNKSIDEWRQLLWD